MFPKRPIRFILLLLPATLAAQPLVHPRDQIALQLGAIQMGYASPFTLPPVPTAEQLQLARNALVQGRNALAATAAIPTKDVLGVVNSPAVNTEAFREQLYAAVENAVTSPARVNLRGTVVLRNGTALKTSARLSPPPNSWTVPVPFAVEAQYARVGQGEPGERGEKGDQGDAGPQGLAGTNGATGPQGPQGLPGTNGAPGLAATIAVGAVTNGAPGSVAVVSNAGTSNAAVFNFTLPQGLTGPQGPAGTNGATGPQGLPGTNGAPGAAATIAVGVVTNGAPGSAAVVSNVGTSNAAVFNFTLPQGPQGPAGADGAVGPQGPAGTNGATGPQGPQGLPGTNGAPGAAATIAVGAVTNGAPGSVAVVSNVGTSNAAVFNFTLPQGLTGPQGPAGTNGATGSQGPQGPAGTNGAVGAQGPAGTNGAPGAAATIAVGVVTNGAPGSVAVVSNVGTSNAAVFNFTLPQGPAGTNGATGPQGPQGATGPQGPAGTNGAAGPQGPAGTNGATGPQGPQGLPGTNGATGPQGPAGPQGPQGEPAQFNSVMFRPYNGSEPTTATGMAGMNYQGVLKDGQGQLITGDRTFVIKLFDAATGGTELYSEMVGTISVTNGIYSFEFGTGGTSASATPSSGVSNALRNSSQPWVEVTVNGVAQTPRQKLLASPFAIVAAETPDTEKFANVLLDLQNKVIQLQAGIPSASSPANLISDAFSDANGVNNLVDANATTATYASPAYQAGQLFTDSTKYTMPINWTSFQLVKTYSNVNSLTFQTSLEAWINTESYIVYNYQDGTSQQSSTQQGTGSDYSKLTLINPSLTKIVSSIEVWARKPTSLGGGNAQVQNIQILKYQSVEIVVDLSSFGKSVTAAQLQLDGSRQSGDSITYAIRNTSVVDSGLPPGEKRVLTTPVAQPAKLHITLTPAQIQSFVVGGTSVKSFSLFLW